MTLEEIISAAVEKKFNEMLEQEFGSCSGGDTLLAKFKRKITSILDEEFKKREPEIRQRIAEDVAAAPISFSWSAYAQIRDRTGGGDQ